MVQFCWYYKKSEKVRFFLLWKSFLVSKWTNYQIIQGIRGDNTILDNLQPFCLLSEHSHILAMSISYVVSGTLCICLLLKVDSIAYISGNFGLQVRIVVTFSKSQMAEQGKNNKIQYKTMILHLNIISKRTDLIFIKN